MSRKQTVYAEGNQAASRKYSNATKTRMESGRAEPAARDATRKTSRGVAKMQRAEKNVLSRAKEKKPPVKEPETPPPAVDDPEPDSRGPKEKEAGVPRSGDPVRR